MGLNISLSKFLLPRLPFLLFGCAVLSASSVFFLVDADSSLAPWLGVAVTTFALLVLFRMAKPANRYRTSMTPAEKAVDEGRLMAVREAYWQATPPGNADLFHFARLVSWMVPDATAGQINAFFMMLPADVLGLALERGFIDVDVEDRIYVFVKKNKEAVLESLASAKSR